MAPAASSICPGKCRAGGSRSCAHAEGSSAEVERRHRYRVQDNSPGFVIGSPCPAARRDHVTLKTAQGRKDLSFDVGYKQYASQSLKVPPRQVNLSKADLARVARERVRIERALSSFSERRPSPCIYRNRFRGRAAHRSACAASSTANPQSALRHGHRRPRRIGVSVPMPERSSIPATIFSTANAVFVDHGRGLSACTASVRHRRQAGQRLAAGARLGLVGMTASDRSHLHWVCRSTASWSIQNSSCARLEVP